MDIHHWNGENKVFKHWLFHLVLLISMHLLLVMKQLFDEVEDFQEENFVF
jgi:hypothetical protein